MGNSVNPGSKRGETPESESLAVAGWIRKVIGEASSWVDQTGRCFVKAPK